MNDPRALYYAAERVAEFPVVTTANVSDSDEWGRVTVSVVLQPECDTVPPRVLGRLTEHDLGVADVSTQGTHLVVTAY